MATFTYQPRNLLEDEMRFAMNVERMRDAAEQRQSRREAESRREQLFQLSLADAKRKNEIAARNHAFTLDNLDKAQQLARIKTDNALAAARDAQNLLAYQERDYDPLAEGLGTLRTGEKNFSQLPVDQQEAVGIHYDAYRTDGSNTMDDDAIRQFALDRSSSGEDDRFQGLRNREWRGALTSSASAGVGKKGNKTGKTSAGDFSHYADLFTPTYNRLLAENMIPKGADRKETFQAAAAIYAANEGKLSPEQAFYRALGLPVVIIGGTARHIKDAKNIYGKRFIDSDKKNDVMRQLNEFSRLYIESGVDELPKGSLERLIALRKLDKKWIDDYGDDFDSPVKEELLHAEYDIILKDLNTAENALSEKHKKRYKWVKDNPDAEIGGWKMNQNLAPTKAEEDASEYQRYFGKEYAVSNARLDYQDFLANLTQLQKFRNALTDRERWIEQMIKARKTGKK